MAGVRAIMLARAARQRCGHIKTELREQVTSLEKEKVENKELSGQVESLEASVVRNKALVEDAEACMSRNVDLHAELKKTEEDLKKLEESCRKAKVA